MDLCNAVSGDCLHVVQVAKGDKEWWWYHSDGQFLACGRAEVAVVKVKGGSCCWMLFTRLRGRCPRRQLRETCHRKRIGQRGL